MLLLHGLLVSSLALAGAPERPPLEGVVHDAEGQPLANASVIIFTARPRVGTSSTCPSCYLDCGKRATTDAAGGFEIPNLDPELLFTIGVLADGHAASFADDVDPAEDAVTVTLTPRPALPEDPRLVARASIVDDHGLAVSGAILNPQGVETAAEGGYRKSFGPMGAPTISSADGSFVIVTRQPGDRVFVLAEASGLATKMLTVPTGGDRAEFQMGRGRAIRGRVLVQGRPLAGVTLGLVQPDRNAETFLGERTATTDERGRFLIATVVPDQPLSLYGKIDGLRGHGAIVARPIDAGDEGSVLDVGDLVVGPGVVLQGRVVLSDGTLVPPDTKLTVGRQEAWDSTQRTLGADGSFRFEGLPPGETVGLSLRVPGYVFSARNGSYIPNPWFEPLLMGRLEADIEGLQILMAPAEDRPDLASPSSPEEWTALSAARRETESQPLRGVAP